MISQSRLQTLAQKHGTPLFVDRPRRTCGRPTALFRKHLPRVQVYYAVKANPDPEIVAHALPGRRELRRRLDAGVQDRLREHQGPAGQEAAGLDLGQDHLRQPHQADRDARAS
jgi:hypothetical protein